MDLKVSTLEDLKDTCITHLKAVQQDMSTLQDERAAALEAYLSRPYGNEVDGRSKFVTSDLSDVVESIMPSLMKTFYGSKNVVSILPVGQEDEKAAKLVEELVNWQFTTQMDGYKILDQWFRDSLYQKMGVIKYWWLEEETYKDKEWDDLTEPEYLNLLEQADAGKIIIDSEEVETESEAVFDQFGMQIQPAVVKYSVKGRKVIKTSRPHVENIPPEEFIFDIKAKDIASCEFVAHKKRVHKSHLLKYKVKDEDVANEIANFESDNLYQTRFQDLGGLNYFLDTENPDYVFIYECYITHYGEKGEKKPMKLVVMGNQVIDAEENKYGKPPFCVLTPICIPHRLVGRDYADMVMPIQELSTYYTRTINDSLAYQNVGMRVVNPFRVQMDDVLNENKPGGVWRTKYDIDPSRVVLPITPTPLPPEAFALMEKMDVMRQERTGITKYQSGMDSKSLNRTATGISQIMNAAMQRVELLARNYAETGVKSLFQALVDLNLDFFDSEVSVRVNKEWLNISPDSIDGSFDILVDVSSSFGTAEIKANQYMQALNTYGMLRKQGTPIPDKYVYNILRELWSVWGYKNVDSYAPATETIVADVQEQQQAMAQVMPPQPMGAPQGAPQGPPMGGMPPEMGMMQ